MYLEFKGNIMISSQDISKLLKLKKPNKIEFLVNKNTNSLIINGDFPQDYETFEIFGKIYESLGLLNPEYEIVIIMTSEKMPISVSLYFGKIQHETGANLAVIHIDKYFDEFLHNIFTLDSIDDINVEDEELIQTLKDTLQTKFSDYTADAETIKKIKKIKEKIKDDIDLSEDEFNSMIAKLEKEDDSISLDNLKNIAFFYVNPKQSKE